MRVCTRCLQPRKLAEFKKDKAAKSGARSICRDCESATRRSWYDRTREVRRKQLRDFHARNPEAQKKYERAWEERAPLERRATVIFHGAKKHAAQRGVPFDPLLSRDVIKDWLVRQTNCECCGRVFCLEQKKNNFGAPTLDRLNSQAGYTLDNLSLICWRCNRVKCDATVSELETVARWMRNKITGG